MNRSQALQIFSLYFKTWSHQKHPILGIFQGQLLHPLIFSFNACLDYENKTAMTKFFKNTPVHTKNIKNKDSPLVACTLHDDQNKNTVQLLSMSQAEEI